ncbi:hypothetical protein [Brevibacillus fulvus]|uniref:Magnesium-transporting ATPase (P-type) n=1 Tax=Brevibacillus fulvus TaxID=1125967 RepID=A0A939BR45_9BACL|nr:hypothetical protein [Brevibacillus fulvus]MBM7589202.1 magnesium-transporting ATPase (P-type) [Brevibacillus fulvus]
MRFVLVLLLVVPWLSLFWLDKQTIKRYMPVTIFTALLMTIIFQIAYTFKWWTIHQSIVPWGYMIDVSFAYGIFTVGTLWIFVLTYRKFWIYLLTNVAMDAIFAFVVFPLLDKTGVATLHKISAWQYFLVILAISLLIYGYQAWQEPIFAAPGNERKKFRMFGDMPEKGFMSRRQKAE